jgi:excinuclease ABC subunit A
MATKKKSPPVQEQDAWIEVIGAKEHNLKNLDLRIPRERLVVITGISGSGKSSLAFDTIFAEASVAISKLFPPMRDSSWVE